MPLPGFKAHERMLGRVRPMPLAVPENARQSAVLSLLFYIDERLNILLMKRKEDNTAHSGQVSFPGGRYEPADADLKATALREAQEEVGIDPGKVDVFGALSSLYIPVSNFNVHPFLAFTNQRPDYSLSHQEVSYILEVPIEEIFHPRKKIKTDVTSPATPKATYNVNAYQLDDGTIIWGATAMILSEIETVLSDVGLI